MFLDCQNPLDLDLIILELVEPLETLAKRAARSAASGYEIRTSRIGLKIMG